uniref:Xylulose kinase-1 n=1 Tax=Tanacetum cinerariifolium TaxID=118510 RepID=A0A699HBR5_TANCI|nr:hypothetical protein [Tanacetum cinerariifolium]
MANLTFADTYNMVAFLSKSNASAGFDQIVDFLNAQVIQYALMVNPTIYVSCIKQLWATTSIKKVNDVVKLRALIDEKRVVVSEDVIQQDLCLDDADGVECLPNEEIFIELARMGYEKPPPKLTFYKAFFSVQLKFLIHTLVQCVSAKRTTWNEFSCSMACAVTCLTTGRKFNFSKYIFENMVRNVDIPSKFLMYPRFLQVMINNQAAEEEDDVEIPAAPTPSSPTNAPSPPPQDPIPIPPQAQPASPSSPPQEQPTDTFESSMNFLNNLMKTCATLSQRVAQLEQEKVAQALEILKLKRKVKKLEKKRRSKFFGLKRLRKGRIDDVSAAATKEVNAVEPTVFDDEEVTMTMDQTLIKMKAEKARLLDEKYQSLKRKPISIAQAWKNMIIYLKNMAGYKMEHFRGMTYDKVRPILEREYNKVQTLFKPDKDVEESKKKRVAEETLLQESFKKLKAVKVSGSHSTQDTPTHDPKEISEEYVQNMLDIVPVSEFKVEALQINAKLQVDEDSEMARDLVMKIFMKANKPKSKSWDTSSK